MTDVSNNDKMLQKKQVKQKYDHFYSDYKRRRLGSNKNDSKNTLTS